MHAIEEPCARYCVWCDGVDFVRCIEKAHTMVTLERRLIIYHRIPGI